MKLSSLLVTLSLFIGASASADYIDFVGPYDVSNWTTTLTGDPGGGGTPAGVDTSGAPGSVALTGGDYGCNTFTVTDCDVLFTIAVVNGFVQFHWDYASNDLFGPSDDPFGYVIGTQLVQLTDDFGASTQSGDVAIPIPPGTTFGFYIDCLECTLGEARAGISAFRAPEPGSLALIGIAIAGGAGALRRRKTQS